VAVKVSYEPKYKSSWALVIGINDYQHCSKLGYARNDAQAVAGVLVDTFQFPKENVTLLLDGQATRKAILDALLAHSEAGAVDPDDRLLVFFAGHGETVTGNRGEVGYLVPADGDCDKLATLIRWDELTRNADMIPAKHVLFIMDACYGGLAVKRHVAPGSRRFLKDMLRRYSRQVLTAGKEDELVADEGGPRPGHSIFTGHLLEALAGKAASKSGFITANGVMAYVYDRVATDHHSDQTPHYGFIDGDGDFIFSELPADALADNPTKGTDVVVEVPATLIDQHDPTTEEQQLGLVKEYLSEPRFRIKLDDLVSANVRAAILKTSDEKFPLHVANATGADVAARLKSYEDAIRPLQANAVLLGKWATADQIPTLTTLMARMSDNCVKPLGGSTLWLGMRWYPLSLLAYSAGIAALSAENYAAFVAVHTKKVDTRTRRIGNTAVPIIVPIVDAMLDLTQTNAWKCLPGHEKHYTPESEYLFKTLQPVLEDLLFLGGSYEQLFDRYEILRAWLYADLTGHGWGPVGRFGWKHSSRMSSDSPYTELRTEAEQQRDQWGPIKAGLFRGSYPRFEQTASKFETELLSKINWF
jgi:hypothetical protein